MWHQELARRRSGSPRYGKLGYDAQEQIRSGQSTGRFARAVLISRVFNIVHIYDNKLNCFSLIKSAHIALDGLIDSRRKGPRRGNKCWGEE